MHQKVMVPVEMPGDLKRFRLPRGVDKRLQRLLDKQDRGEPLTREERQEAEGIVSLADFLTLLRSRAERLAKQSKNGR